MISGYLGKGPRFDRAVAAFAGRYADQVDEDHASLVRAIADGRLDGPAAVSAPLVEVS